MMILLIFALVIGGYALYTMTPDERTGLKERLIEAAERARKEAARRQAEPEPFRDALRERTPWPLVMPALVAVNVIVFLMMGLGTPTAEPESLVAWGASFGPRTTNGEWWRLVASMFVHPGFFQLLVNCAALVQLGLILERLVGHITFAAVYVAAGVLASLVSLSDYPMAVSAGASGAIFGLYGLLLASSAWAAIHRAPAEAAQPQPVALGTFGFRDLPQVEPVQSREANERRSPSGSKRRHDVDGGQAARTRGGALPSLQHGGRRPWRRSGAGRVCRWLHLRHRADERRQREHAAGAPRGRHDGGHRDGGCGLCRAAARRDRRPPGNRARARGRGTHRERVSERGAAVQARHRDARGAGADDRAERSRRRSRRCRRA